MQEESKQILKALIRSLRQLAGLLDKILKGENI